MGGLSPLHWLLVLLVVVLIFGTKKLRNVGHDLGSAIKGFKQGMNEGSSDKPSDVAEKTSQTIEGEIREKSKS